LNYILKIRILLEENCSLSCRLKERTFVLWFTRWRYNNFYRQMGISWLNQKDYCKSIIWNSPIIILFAICMKNFSTFAAIHKDGLLYLHTIGAAYNKNGYGSFLIVLLSILRNKKIIIFIFVIDNCLFNKADPLRKSFERKDIKWSFYHLKVYNRILLKKFF
jgi:hypothetical protein